jgi:hypothetical protein
MFGFVIRVDKEEEIQKIINKIKLKEEKRSKKILLNSKRRIPVPVPGLNFLDIMKGTIRHIKSKENLTK